MWVFRASVNAQLAELRARQRAFLWHHQHHFEAVVGGVMMRDIVDYAIPFGFIGSLANKLLVKKAVIEIFEFRKQKIAELF
jgi:ligand-binding SRPBCC domain-containing protein